jgi:hypothetical protein
VARFRLSHDQGERLMFRRGFSITEILPTLMTLSRYIKVGLEHYAQLKAAGVELSPEILAGFLESKLDDWNPEFRGVSLLGGGAKHHLAMFLASVIFNIGDQV